MPGPYVIRGSVSLPEAELMWRFSRSSGPGGQHVNTSDSQVELRFDLAATEALPPVWKERALERLAGRLTDGVVSVRASEHRSQWRNRETAATRLAALLAEATAPPPRPPPAHPRAARHQRTPAAAEEAARRDQARTQRARLVLRPRQRPSGARPRARPGGCCIPVVRKSRFGATP
ncbi:alternative ribosome rescue aminoacyl-tRNA hydrolase ArfB [Streptomyces pactum]|uniref:alternative ribosome rescue aminoacyl-tRNA hydrolase ArfB n=1 Tax=Streptomyces pactum TaxID=68249 RepID=UPI001E3E0AD4|nr:alternative ribosome rescue aminoacyl-tRNA hydrolase ArfB [Streptomyces pactum]